MTSLNQPSIKISAFLQKIGSDLSFGDTPPGAWMTSEKHVSEVLTVSVGNWILAGNQNPMGLACAIDHALEVLPRTPGSEHQIDPKLSGALATLLARETLNPKMLRNITSASNRISLSIKAARGPDLSAPEKDE